MDSTLKDFLLGRKVDSALAGALAADYADWTALAAATSEDLKNRFGEGAAEQVAKAKLRRDIPRPTVRRLMDECDGCCCYCWSIDHRIGVLIHHVDEHAAIPDDSYENLVVLCPNHHSEVHRRYENARHPYTPDLLRMQKLRFASAVAAFRTGRGPAPGRESAAPRPRPAAPPLPPKQFTGRSHLLADIKTALLGGKRRAALVGMGGVGKTTLALKGVESLHENFPAGIFWMEIHDGEESPHRLMQVLIGALGGDDSSPDEEARLAFVQELLVVRSGKEGALLLAFDNVSERVLPDLRKMLAGLSDRISVLVTTRETTTAVALDAKPLQISPLPRQESSELLAAYSDGKIPKEAPAAERLLTLLGDLPLAVELVARQIALLAPKPGFSIGGLCDRLERFNDSLLSFPGHQALARSFALSYENMLPDEQRLFRSLGAFAEGQFPADAVSATAALDRFSAEASLDRLVSISVLQWDAAPGFYRTHTLLRKYAEFQLEKSAAEERQTVAERSRTYFITSANSIAMRQPADLPAMDIILANYTVAIQEAAKAQEHSTVANSLSIVVRGTDYFAKRGQEKECLPLLEAAAACAEKIGDQDLVAELLAHRGRALLRLCRVTEGIRLYEQAIRIVRRTGNIHDLSSALQNLGQALVSEGKDLPRAEKALREALEIAERAKNAEALSATFTSLGGLYRHLGRLADAAEMYGRGLQSARLFSNRFSEGNNLSNLGLVLLDTGKLDAAEQSIRAALDIAREISDRRGEGNRTGHLGRILLERARALKPGPEKQVMFEDAVRHVASALAIARETNDPEKAAMWQMNAGTIHDLLGRHDSARDEYRAALEVAAELDSPLLEGQIRLNLGASLYFSQLMDEALVQFTTAKNLLESAGSPYARRAEAGIAAIWKFWASRR